MTAYTSLREANAARQKLWDPHNTVGIFWRVNELAGEVGEVCNMIKKVVRQQEGLRGSRVSLPELGEELADVIICADLVALTLGEQVPAYTTSRIANIPTEPLLLGIRLTRLSGRLCELYDQPHVPDNFAVMNRINDLVVSVRAAMLLFGFAPEPTISNKFNRTSEKVNLPVRLAMSPPQDAKRDLETVDLNPQRRVGKAPELGMPYGGQRRDDPYIDGSPSDIARRRREEDERLLSEQGGINVAVGVAAGMMLTGSDDVAAQQPDIAQSRAEAMEPKGVVDLMPPPGAADGELHRSPDSHAPDAPEPEPFHSRAEPNLGYADPTPAPDTPSYDSGSSSSYDSGGGGQD